MILDLCISQLKFRLYLHKEIQINENYLPFSTDISEQIDCSAYFELIDKIKQPESNCVGMDFDHTVYQDSPEDYTVYYFQPGHPDYYARSKADSEGISSFIQIDQLQDCRLNGLNNYFHMIGWEKMLAFHNRMVLHSSCIRTVYGAVLFSGPSGIGKSTQADLWQTYRGAELLNGDRTILYRTDVWRGYGSPFAGSSQCYKNENVPVKAVIMLEQSKKCSIRRLNLKEAFQKLYAGMTVYTWDPDYVSRIADLVLAFAGEIPVYHLACTPDEDAVILLEKVLREEGNGSE